MEHQVQFSYYFGPFRLDPNKRVLTNADEVVQLPPKQYETLLALVRSGGVALSKDELINAVWEDSFVEESNLAQHIFHLRKALADEEDEAPYIETIPKYGYRFVATVREVRENGVGEVAVTNTVGDATTSNRQEAVLGDPKNDLATTQLLGRFSRHILIFVIAVVGFGVVLLAIANRQESNTPKSLAVLPFNLVAGEGIEESYRFGIADALISKLSNLDEISVRPTSSIVKYSGQNSDPIIAGRELGVDTVLNGTVQRSEGRIRITIQLINIGTQASLWSDKFDISEREVFDVQDLIAERAATTLVSRLAGGDRGKLMKRPTSNVEAYEAYIRGRYLWNKRRGKDVEKAVKYFEEAVNKDPSYSLAYAGLADAYVVMSSYGLSIPESNEYQRLADAAANRAIELDPGLAEPYATLGLLRFEQGYGCWAAEQKYLQALEQNPNYATARHWRAWCLIIRGDLDGGIAELRRAREIDPLSLGINIALGQAYFLRGDHQAAVDQFDRTLELDANMPTIFFFKGLALAEMGRLSEAENEFRRSRETYGDNDLATIGWFFAKEGRDVEARQILAKAKSVERGTWLIQYEIALLHLALNEKDMFQNILDQKILNKLNTSLVVMLLYDPRLRQARSDPASNAWLARVKEFAKV